MSTAVLSLARIHTDKIQGETASYLYINLDSPLIQRLLMAEETLGQQIANLLRSFTLMMSRHNDEQLGIDLSEALTNFSESLLQLTEAK
jgi:hypothetical protein